MTLSTCPCCGTKLGLSAGWFRCARCGRQYSERGDVQENLFDQPPPVHIHRLPRAKPRLADLGRWQWSKR